LNAARPCFLSRIVGLAARGHNFGRCSAKPFSIISTIRATPESWRKRPPWLKSATRPVETFSGWRHGWRMAESSKPAFFAAAAPRRLPAPPTSRSKSPDAPRQKRGESRRIRLPRGSEGCLPPHFTGLSWRLRHSAHCSPSCQSRSRNRDERRSERGFESRDSGR
jgi:hypothetical protein